MKVFVEFRQQVYQANLEEPMDISIPLKAGMNNVNCFYAPPMEVWPVVAGDFVGSTKQGGPLNFMNVQLNPHGNGTHTECVGHIAKEEYTINQCLRKFFFLAELLSIFPRKTANGDRVIFADQLEELIQWQGTKAIIIRTLPNDGMKLSMNHSGANPPYLHHEAIEFLTSIGIEHLLVDLPSVDREEDGGALLSHKSFWQYPVSPKTNRTITELVYVPMEIKDGLYFLNLQIGSFELDVSPSKPVLYKLSTTKM